MSTYYFDCEFDGGSKGPLLSIALISTDSESHFGGPIRSFYYIATHVEAKVEWVRENVVPILDLPQNVCNKITRLESGDIDLGRAIREFLGDDQSLTFVSDSPVDVARLSRILSTDYFGNWQSSAMYPRIDFSVRNVDYDPAPFPGFVKHNAFYDAAALRYHVTGLDVDWITK